MSSEKKKNLEIRNFYPDTDIIDIHINGGCVTVSRDEHGTIYIEVVDPDTNDRHDLVLGEPTPGPIHNPEEN
jgi:hypothetical protein